MHDQPMSSAPARQRLADFATLTDALDYAASGDAGLSFHSGRGDLVERLSYRDLRRQARRLARQLLRAGLRRGDRLALLAETNADFVRAFCAAQYAGIIPSPLPVPTTFGGRREYVDQIRRQIASFGAAAALGPSGSVDHLREATEGLALRLVGGLDTLRDLPVDGVDLPTVCEDDLSYLQFSSGSTRFPRGIAISHRALMSNARAIAQHGLRVTASDRCVSWLPFYHDMGLVGFLLSPIASQIPVDYLSTYDFARRPLLWLLLLSQNCGTISYSPSFGYELCSRRGSASVPDGLDLSSWRVAGVGGDLVRPDALRDFAETFAPTGFRPEAFLPSYGLAEATLAVSFAPLNTGIQGDRIELDALADGRAVPATAPTAERRHREFVLCGSPLPGLQVEVRGPDGAVVPERVLGRIHVSGPSLMNGYLSDEAATRLALSPDRWLDTGDLGYKLGSSIVIAGRLKDLIIVNGRNLWPQDLEWAAEQVPGLRSGDVAAFAINDASGERVVLLVQCRSTDPEGRRKLVNDVTRVVRAAAAIDCTVTLVPPRSLPRTSSGKLSRTHARRYYLDGTFVLPEAGHPLEAAATGPNGVE